MMCSSIRMAISWNKRQATGLWGSLPGLAAMAAKGTESRLKVTQFVEDVLEGVGAAQYLRVYL